MHNDPQVAAMLANLEIANAVRARFATGDAALARQDFRHWQAERLARTHADLLTSPRFGKAAVFFLTDLYSPTAKYGLYAQAERVMPVAVRVLPHDGLETVANAWELDAISEKLDEAIIDALQGQTQNLTPARYAAAYKLVGQPAQRARQIDLIGELVKSLAHFATKPFATITVAALRKPSQLAGFGDLQAFLQRGMEALRHMGPIAPFIDTVTTRERRLMTELLVGDPALLEWYPPDGGEKAP